VGDVRFVRAAKLEDPGAGAGGDNDLAATEETASRQKTNSVLGRDGMDATVRDRHDGHGIHDPRVVLGIIRIARIRVLM
jgi:hypothetical protein